ncbi:MAG: universal stress protein [Gemmataceae bacterium]|nr:universal stress protein [Gemmataceae bacterium]MCI0740718.1 universal stress protein [Gemmataceae bacterium]
MLGLRTILHPTDFSPNSEYALHVASALARDYNANLILLHVYSVPVAMYGYGEGMLPPKSDQLETLTRELHQIQVADVRLTHLLVEGDAVNEILRVANENQADLVVMGTHGRRGLKRLLMGSVAEMVVRRASCPVLTVRTPVHEEALSGDTQTAEPMVGGGV